MRRRERERGVSLSVEERRKKKEENVLLLLLLLLLLLWGIRTHCVQSGHSAHIPAPDGLVEGLGVVECCMG